MRKKTIKISLNVLIIFDLFLLLFSLILFVINYSNSGLSSVTKSWAFIIGIVIITTIIILFIRIIFEFIFFNKHEEKNNKKLEKKHKLKNFFLSIFACGAFIFIAIGYAFNFLLIGLLPQKDIDHILETNLIIKIFVVYGQILSFIFFICFAITLFVFFREKPELSPTNLI